LTDAASFVTDAENVGSACWGMGRGAGSPPVAAALWERESEGWSQKRGKEALESGGSNAAREQERERRMRHMRHMERRMERRMRHMRHMERRMERRMQHMGLVVSPPVLLLKGADQQRRQQVARHGQHGAHGHDLCDPHGKEGGMQ
jgi:hypothetical protein